MAIAKFIIPPNQQGYGFEDGAETVATALAGGSARYARDILGAAYKMTVQWTLNAEEYKYARAFYRSVTISGSLPFLIDLYTDLGNQLLEHQCHFVPASFSLKSQQGLSFIVAATLEVIPLDPSSTDADHVYLINEFGFGNYADFIDELNTTINTDIPNAMTGA
jgi:hypothetical protein